LNNEAKPVRRVVTGRDGNGKSGVLFDSDAPNVRSNPDRPGSVMTECWCFDGVPIGLAGDRDDGRPPFTFHPPQAGAFFRLVRSVPAPPGYDPETDPNATAEHPPKENPETGRGDRGGGGKGRSPIHRTRSVDYGVVLEGRRRLLLDDTEFEMQKGDVVIQLGNYHQWANPTETSHMAFIMIGGNFRI
jgi:mannose-6-phosphate isomerase-like protein (cupin superfamily)